MTQISELRALTVEELTSKLLDLRKEQFQLRIKRSTGALEKFHRFGQVKTLIAQVKTLLTEKQREVERGESR